MSAEEWTRRVFRLRKLPNYISSRTEAARLLGEAVGLPADHVVVYSLANTCDIWDTPPSKVATLQFRAVPSCLREARSDDEWTVLAPGSDPSEALILDTHFKGMTALNDVEPVCHKTE